MANVSPGKVKAAAQLMVDVNQKETAYAILNKEALNAFSFPRKKWKGKVTVDTNAQVHCPS